MERELKPDGKVRPGEESHERNEAAAPATERDSASEAVREKEADADVPPAMALPQREDAAAQTVIGLGGSAGSIAALQAFFENVPPDSVSAYVVVLHLSPDVESHLAEVLSRSSRLPVQQVIRTVRIKAGHVYVIPPGKDLEMRDGTLELRDTETMPGRRIVIDTFFRTLAEAHGPQSAAVVFSGTGADGTLGIRQIKEAGGLVVAQSPSEAEYDAMPRSAIATGLVDYVLPVNAMPAQIAAYWETSRVMRIPREAAPSPEQRKEGADQEVALHDILTHVRVQTGHDFSFYKRATTLRRIGRRMQVNGLTTLPAYRDFLRSHPAEGGDLIGDLLISVTQFFRDPEAWATLERDVVPQLFTDRRGNEAKPGFAEAEIRAWVCGCATGEEAYTLAILLLEQAERLPRPPRVQVFATDMDAPAIARARVGIYPETIAGDVSEERLRRWFYRQGGSYQVRKEVREVVLFAHHDVLRDTPFSRLDLITCRNLLIYLNREAQERVFRTFHFALHPDRFVLLGPSESAEGMEGLFLATNKSQRLFTRRAASRSALPPVPVPFLLPPAARGNAVTGGTIARGEVLRSSRVPSGSAEGASDFTRPPSLLSSRPDAGSGGSSSVTRDFLPRYGPPVAVVNEEYTVVHLSGSVSDFLRLPEGEPTYRLLELVRPDLRPELRGALFQAAQEGTEQTRVVRSAAAQEDPEDRALARTPLTRLSVRPVPASPEADTPGHFVVQFEALSEAVLAAFQPLFSEPLLLDASPAPGNPPASSVESSTELAHRLEQENAALQRNLHVSSEQYDAVTEELKASNEEMQAVNEEMRSVVEELETGKEELQSVNEELSTVNYELKARVEELTTLNSNLSNFLGATDIATLFLDRVLNVRRFTSAALALFNLIPTDVGRPLAHVTNHLNYPALEEDAKAVLSRLIPVEREVTSTDGQRHFLARLLPYRSLDDRIEGVVVNFIDITDRKRAEEAKFFLASIVESSEDSVITVDFDGTITSWNKAAEHLYGYPATETVGKSVTMLTLPGDLAQVLRNIDDVKNSRRVVRFDTVRVNKDKREITLEVVMSPVKDAGEEVIGVSTVARDITERIWAEERLRDAADFDAFRVTMGDALGPLTDPVEIQAVASRVLGEQLAADRAYYVEIHEASREFVVACDWHRPEAASHARRYPLEDWPMPWLNDGQAWVMKDVDSDPILPDEQRASYRGNDIRAAVVVPLLKEGRLVATFVVNQNAPRDWEPKEVALVRETAGRTWAAVERASAEEAVRESQKQLRLALDAAEMGAYIWYPQEDRGDVDARVLALYGLREGETLNVAEALAKLVHPDDRELFAAAIARAVDPSGDGKLEMDFRVIHPDGSLHWLHSQGQTFFEGENPPRAASIFGMLTDITPRKRREANLTFLAEADQGLMQLTNIDETMGSLCAKIGEHFKVARVVFAEIGQDETTSVIRHEWRQAHLPTLKEAAELKNLLVSKLEAAKRDGEISYIKDVAAELREAALTLTTLGIASLLGAPLVRDEKLHLYLGILHSEPREWCADEIELMRELTARIRTRLERAHAEEALRESEGRLRALVENLPGGAVFIIDKNLRYLVAEGAALAAAGFVPQDLIGRTIAEAMPPELIEIYEPKYRRALLGEAFEHEHEAHDRRYISRGVPLRAATGDVYAVLAISYDITERKQAEEASRHSEARFRTLSDAIPQVIWTNTADGTANYFNQRWYEYTGLTYEESAGPGWQAVVHPDDAPASVERWQQALAAGEVFDAEYRLRRHDGVYRWFLGRNVPLKDDQGRVTGWFGTATDIEDWKQAQAARQESEERFRLLVEGVKDYAMFLLDAWNRITFWSAGAERVFGWSEAEVMGQTGDIIFTDEDQEAGEAAREVGTARAEGRALDRRWHRRKDGSQFWADGVLMRLDDEAGNLRGFAKVARDATEQKRTEEAIHEALEAVALINEDLEARVLERTRELSEMSQMRQELLRKLVTAQEQERGRISRDLHDDTGQHVTALLLGLNNLKNLPSVAGVSEAQTLLAHLLDLGREVAQKSHRLSFTLRPTALDDQGLIGALQNYVEEWERWSGLPVAVESVGVDGRLPPEIETTIYRVVQEALTNVLRYATAPVAGAATQVSILVQRRGGDIVTTVEDDGHGFDVEAALNQPPGKRRLGIFGMQERARLAGGTLEIESAPGEGTTVYLRIPLPQP